MSRPVLSSLASPLAGTFFLQREAEVACGDARALLGHRLMGNRSGWAFLATNPSCPRPLLGHQCAPVPSAFTERSSHRGSVAPKGWGRERWRAAVGV